MSTNYSETRFGWLKSYLENEEEIASLQINLTRSRIELTRWVEGDLQNVKIQPRSHSSKLEEIIADSERLLEEDLILRKRTIELIEHFTGIENQILRMKYVEGMSLVQISEVDGIGYSYETIKKIHAELKRRLHFLDMWDLPERHHGAEKVHSKTN